MKLMGSPQDNTSEAMTNLMAKVRQRPHVTSSRPSTQSRCSEPAQTLPWLMQGSVSGSEQRTLCRRSARCAQYPSLQVFVCSQLVVLRCFHRRCGLCVAQSQHRPSHGSRKDLCLALSNGLCVEGLLDVPSTLRFKYLSAHNWWFCAVSTEGVVYALLRASTDPPMAHARICVWL